MPTTNLICGEIGCYSNCRIDCKSNAMLDLKGFPRCPCDKCHHSLWDHHCCHARWEPIIDKEVSVDQNMKERWEAVKDGEKPEALIKASKTILNEPNLAIDHAINDLTQLVGQYAHLVLSESFSAQMGSAVRLLEQNYAFMEKRSISHYQLRKVEESLNLMKRKLELLAWAW